ncbi:hypothetical protein AY599_23630 [Leptolyngbya valderiana BDU 20041]|nr:hypothetical protein AY599_23630 [Leptolyngbya valderiana BDU 20041]
MPDRFGRTVPDRATFEALPVAMRRDGLLLMRERAESEGRHDAAARIDALIAALPHSRPFLHPTMVQPHAR